ncbi:unnamed protein product [Hymenolepis diminuta]|nr:unnamed protein product [Hymenolepis diminuta]
MSRPKKGISKMIRERIRRWQADRDRAEGVDLRFPRFPVLANRESSKISETDSTSSEMPLEPCDVDLYSWKRAGYCLKTNAWSDNAKVEPVIPVVGQLIKLQRSPALCGPLISEAKESNESTGTVQETLPTVKPQKELSPPIETLPSFKDRMRFFEMAH